MTKRDKPGFPPCKHRQLAPNINVIRSPDGFWNLEVQLQCNVCGVPYVFTGLPQAELIGDGAVVNTDGTVLTVSIVEQGQDVLTNLVDPENHEIQ